MRHCVHFAPPALVHPSAPALTDPYPRAAPPAPGGRRAGPALGRSCPPPAAGAGAPPFRRPRLARGLPPPPGRLALVRPRPQAGRGSTRERGESFRYPMRADPSESGLRSTLAHDCSGRHVGQPTRTAAMDGADATPPCALLPVPGCPARLVHLGIARLSWSRTGRPGGSIGQGPLFNSSPRSRRWRLTVSKIVLVRSCFSSRWRNCSNVVASGTDSVPKSIPTKLRNAWLS